MSDPSYFSGLEDVGIRPLPLQAEAAPGQAWCQWVKIAPSAGFSTSRSGWYVPGSTPVKMTRREFWVEVLDLLTKEGNLQLDGCHCLGGVLSLGGPGFLDAANLLAHLTEYYPTVALHDLAEPMGRYGVWLKKRPDGHWCFTDADDSPNLFSATLKGKKPLQEFMGGVSYALKQAGTVLQANFLDRQVEACLDDGARKLLRWPAKGPEGQWFYTKEQIALWQLEASLLAENPQNLDCIEAGFDLDARQHLEAIRPLTQRGRKIQARLLSGL
jgi:hypothetical protein